MVFLRRLSFIAFLLSFLSAGGVFGQLNQQVKLGRFSQFSQLKQSGRLALVYPGISQAYFNKNLTYSSVNYQVSFATDRINQYFQSDSVKTTAAIFGSKRARRTVKLGLLVGGASYVGGLGLSYLVFVLPSEGCGLGCAIAMIVVPAGIGVLGIIGGGIYGYVSGKNLESTRATDVTNLRQLNRLGLRLNVNFNTSQNNSLVERVWGLSFRHLPLNVFLPNRYSLKFGSQGGYHLLLDKNDGKDYANFVEQHVNLTKLGLEAVHLNPNRIIGLIYGIDVGVTWGKTSEYLFEDNGSSGETSGKTWSPYTKMILGLNINLLNWASLEAMYNVEPFGFYQKEAKRYKAQQQIVHSFGFGLSFYW